MIWQLCLHAVTIHWNFVFYAMNVCPDIVWGSPRLLYNNSNMKSTFNGFKHAFVMPHISLAIPFWCFQLLVFDRRATWNKCLLQCLRSASQEHLLVMVSGMQDVHLEKNLSKASSTVVTRPEIFGCCNPKNTSSFTLVGMHISKAL